MRSSRPWSRPPLFLNASRVNAFDQPGAVCIVEEKVDHQQLEDTLAPVKDFAAVSRVDWRPKCSRILDGVNSQYIWPQHFIFSFCSILLKICHRLRGLWGQGTDRSSAPSRFAPLCFLLTVTTSTAPLSVLGFHAVQDPRAPRPPVYARDCSRVLDRGKSALKLTGRLLMVNFLFHSGCADGTWLIECVDMTGVQK